MSLTCTFNMVCGKRQWQPQQQKKYTMINIIWREKAKKMMTSNGKTLVVSESDVPMFYICVQCAVCCSYYAVCLVIK